MATSFFSPEGEFKLASQKEPVARCPYQPGSSGTMFSWAPALPGGTQLGDDTQADAG
eukprot:CAMPEP_0119330400 /NCGR_PEP_ID=MMETSP1333-20130426/78192_1 /TAXON_ID=418940 /ORGANISM="Scyphosphaera apsteinii, Strain RCC1455" /LENGTH=56 /DNA_ID=CAMNT_0007339785 /DNA_START=14 /DNA_END=181 /DNA_ORIENTATION=+